MRLAHLAAISTLSLALVAPVLTAQSNADDTKAAREQLKRDHKAEKAQAKADKKQRKALGTHEQKEADKAQDKADRKAAEATPNR